MLALDSLYDHLWARFESQPACIPPRDRPFLYNLIPSASLSPSSQVLDAGCGRGDHAFALARRLPGHVTGIDLLESRVQDAATRDDRPPNTTFLQAGLEALPFADHTFDVIWCADVLLHIANLPAVFHEFHRTLRPAGMLLLLVTTETPAMQPAETDYYPHLAIQPASVRRENLEHAFRAVGFTPLRTEELHAELLESSSPNASPELTHLARLNRHREQLLAAWGSQRYLTLHAFYLHLTYHLLGKLSNTAYLLQPQTSPE